MMIKILRIFFVWFNKKEGYIYCQNKIFISYLYMCECVNTYTSVPWKEGKGKW